MDVILKQKVGKTFQWIQWIPADQSDLYPLTVTSDASDVSVSCNNIYPQTDRMCVSCLLVFC